MSIVRMRNASKDWVDAYQSETTDEGRAQVVEAFQAQIDAYGDWEHFPSFVRLVKAVQNEPALLRALKPSQFCSVLEMTIQGGAPGFSIPLIAAVREIPELFDEVTVDDVSNIAQQVKAPVRPVSHRFNLTNAVYTRLDLLQAVYPRFDIVPVQGENHDGAFFIFDRGARDMGFLTERVSTNSLRHVRRRFGQAADFLLDDARRVLGNLANGDQALHSVVENPDRVAEAAEDQLAYEDMTAES